MSPDIRWITPLYGFDAGCTHISVPEKARGKLLEMTTALVGTRGLVAIYIPLGTNDAYEPGLARGRVLGAVRLLKKPSRKKLEDYNYDDLDGTPR